MQLKSLWFIPSLLIGAFAFSDDHGNLGSGVLKQTATGSFYSSQETMDEGFPFSDVVVVSGELVFLSGLVGTDVEGELVDGGLVPESHAIFRQMQNHLDQMGLDLDDVVKCLVMIDNIDEWADFNNIYTSYFKPPYPARSAFGADGLALGAALELECTAVKLSRQKSAVLFTSHPLARRAYPLPMSRVGGDLPLVKIVNLTK